MRKVVVILALSVAAFLSITPLGAHADTALCFHCGELHFGALNACDKCGFQPDMDNFSLWTAFSDQFMTHETLTNFGAVMKEIHKESTDFEERLWVFLKYVVDTYPQNELIDGKSLKIPAPYNVKVPMILNKLNLKPFELKKPAYPPAGAPEGNQPRN